MSHEEEQTESTRHILAGHYPKPGGSGIIPLISHPTANRSSSEQTSSRQIKKLAFRDSPNARRAVSDPALNRQRNHEIRPHSLGTTVSIPRASPAESRSNLWALRNHPRAILVDMAYDSASLKSDVFVVPRCSKKAAIPTIEVNASRHGSAGGSQSVGWPSHQPSGSITHRKSCQTALLVIEHGNFQHLSRRGQPL